MNYEELAYLCTQVSKSFRIPLRLYCGEIPMYTWSLSHFPIDPFHPYEKKLFSDKEPVFSFYTPFRQFYGGLCFDEWTIIVGPSGCDNYSIQQSHDYALFLGITSFEFKQLYDQMQLIPHLSSDQFFDFLLLLQYMFTHKRGDKNTVFYYTLSDDFWEDFSKEKQENDSDKYRIPSAKEPLTFERGLLSFVRAGDKRGLQNYLNTCPHGNGGFSVPDPLRHQKNMFIVTLTLVSRAAVDAGLTVLESMTTADYYIHHCEKLTGTDAVMSLQYHMLLDYTGRIAALSYSEDINPLTSGIITYIQQNISTDLKVQRLAGHFHVSRKTLCRHFQTDMKQTVGEYVLSLRIRRAKDLLANTSLSLAEIADSLGFSSQSHFQTLFKNRTGITPTQYREKGDE